MPSPLDPALFLLRLEKACATALHEVRTFPCEETCQRASGRLEGILHGAAAVLMSVRLEEADPGLLEEAREIVGRSRRALEEISETYLPPP